MTLSVSSAAIEWHCQSSYTSTAAHQFHNTGVYILESHLWFYLTATAGLK